MRSTSLSDPQLLLLESLYSLRSLARASNENFTFIEHVGAPLVSASRELPCGCPWNDAVFACVTIRDIDVASPTGCYIKLKNSPSEAESVCPQITER
jgi:hypothetical protein